MATDGSWTSVQVRTALLEYRGAHKGGAYPSELREHARRCACRMRAKGLAITQIAAELGVTSATASVWSEGAQHSEQAGESMTFVPVVVEERDRQVCREGRFEIAFPTGAVLRVEGVDSDTVRAAITALNTNGGVAS